MHNLRPAIVNSPMRVGVSWRSRFGGGRGGASISVEIISPGVRCGAIFALHVAVGMVTNKVYFSACPAGRRKRTASRGDVGVACLSRVPSASRGQRFSIVARLAWYRDSCFSTARQGATPPGCGCLAKARRPWKELDAAHSRRLNPLSTNSC